MLNVLKIALRNLARFGRRTLLTSTLITLGIVSVLLFVAIAGSFKAMMIGQFTDAVLGHIEVHRKGYVASIDNLPLNLNMQPAMVARGGTGAEETGCGGGLLEPRETRRHVQQFHRDHQHTHQRHRSPGGSGDDADAARTHDRRQQARPGAQARGNTDTAAARAGHESQSGRYHRAGRHQPRRLGQRQDLHRQGHTRERVGAERPRRLHPDRRCARAAADEGRRGQRNRDSPEESGATGPGHTQQADRRTLGGRDQHRTGKAGAGGAHLGRPVAVREHRAHDRPADAVHQDHAGVDRAGQHHECHGHGGVRAHPRDRDHRRHRHAAAQDPVLVSCGRACCSASAEPRSEP